MAAGVTTNKVLMVIVAFLLPPLAVGLKEGIGTSFIINVVLTLLLWLHGFIHALIVVLR